MNSVLAQSYTDIEHIIVDGGSTDDTMKIVREIEPRYHGNLKYVSEPDKGIYDAMNKGLKMATGDIIGILNSDDFYSSADVLMSVVDNIDGVDAVFADVHYIKDNNVREGIRYYSSRRFKRWKMCMGFMPAHPSFYCRRDIYEQFGLFDPSFRIAADFELLLRFIYLHNISIRYISKNFVTMRIGGASTSGLGSHRQIFKDHMNAYRKNNVYSNFLLEGCRYIYKIAEVSYYKLRLPFDNRKRKKTGQFINFQSPSEYILSWSQGSVL